MRLKSVQIRINLRYCESDKGFASLICPDLNICSTAVSDFLRMSPLQEKASKRAFESDSLSIGPLLPILVIRFGIFSFDLLTCLKSCSDLKAYFSNSLKALTVFAISSG